MDKDTIKKEIADNIEKDEDIDELLSELFKKKRQKQNNLGMWGGGWNS